MYLAQLLTPDLIRLNVSTSDKWALLDDLAGLIMDNRHLSGHPTLDRNQFHLAVVAREKDRATTIGHGCALPHARIPELKSPACCLATLANPIDFEAPDGKPVHTVCLLLSPEEDPSITLKVMAELAALLSNEEMRAAISSAREPEALYEIIRTHGEGREHPVTAHTIMRDPSFDIHPDTPLTKVTRLMQEHHVDAVSVVEPDGTLVGEISCDELCHLGLPDFFSQLKSVAFVKNFDPFENYFKGLKGAVAGNVMTKEYSALPEEATLLEVIFELTVHKHPKVYVTRDGKRIGVIDRSAVLSRVINF